MICCSLFDVMRERVSAVRFSRPYKNRRSDANSDFLFKAKITHTETIMSKRNMHLV
jgi:hypothetical protein